MDKRQDFCQGLYILDVKIAEKYKLIRMKLIMLTWI